MYRKVLGVLISILVLSMIAGCAQSGGGQEDSNSGQKDRSEKRQERKKKEDGPVGKAKAVKGVVTKVDTEKGLLWVRPGDADKSELIRIRPNSLEKVTLHGKEADTGDIKKGQPATVRYVPINVEKDGGNTELKVARIVRLGSEGGEQTGGEGTGG